MRTVKHGSAHDLGDLARGDPLELVQDEDDALLVGEPVEQATEGAHALAPLGVLVGGGRLAAEQSVARRLVGEDGAAARGPPVHEHDVDRDAVQPGAELRLPAEVLQALVDLDEDLLDDVLEVAPAPEHAVDEAGDVGAVALVELPEGGGVPRRSPRNEPLFFRNSHARGHLTRAAFEGRAA